MFGGMMTVKRRKLKNGKNSKIIYKNELLLNMKNQKKQKIILIESMHKLKGSIGLHFAIMKSMIIKICKKFGKKLK